MTPKEKATQLVSKYLFYFPEFRNEKEYDYDTDKAKECALIAVDEVIDAIDWHESKYPVSEELFWLEVKNEIEKL